MTGKNTKMDKDTITALDRRDAEAAEALYQKYPGTRPTPEERVETRRLLSGNPIMVTFPNWPQAAKRTLYYRVSPENGGLVFASLERAEYVSGIYDALEAKTWGEFKEKLPPDEHEQIVCTLFDDNEEPRPEDTDPFNSMCVPGYCDGDYPDWLQPEMDSYVPDAILTKYGSLEHTMLNGSYYHIEKKHEEAICKDLRALGFNVVRRGDLYFG